jgi:hypothetical protein
VISVPCFICISRFLAQDNNGYLGVTVFNKQQDTEVVMKMVVLASPQRPLLWAPSLLTSDGGKRRPGEAKVCWSLGAQGRVPAFLMLLLTPRPILTHPHYEERARKRGHPSILLGASPASPAARTAVVGRRLSLPTSSTFWQQQTHLWVSDFLLALRKSEA